MGKSLDGYKPLGPVGAGRGVEATGHDSLGCSTCMSSTINQWQTTAFAFAIVIPNIPKASWEAHEAANVH